MTMPSPISRQIYVQRVLDLYHLAPGTTGHCAAPTAASSANSTYRGVALEIVYAAMILAVARRTFRSAAAPPLAPIATLHYIRPLVDELIARPPEPGYLSYIRYKLATLAPDFAAAADRDHQLP